jgi:tetratricopeptide (TPR) repeat protein
VSARGKAFAIAFAMLLSSTAEAAPTVWQRARVPSLAEEQALVDQAEQTYLRAMRQRRAPGGDGAQVSRFWLREVKRLLDEAHAETSRSLTTRALYADVLSDLGDHEHASRLLADLQKKAPPPIRAHVSQQLALAYAHLDRTKEEIAAYDDALRFEPEPEARALLFANQAEAQMRIGDLSAAVTGYNKALSLTLIPTTLWGLGVALDRSGDLDGALQAIRLARSYDPRDQGLSSTSWFFVPPWDELYYRALGHWARARQTDLASVRGEELGRAIQSWTDYIAAAPIDDHYAPFAKARLKACEQERALALRAARLETTKPKPKK